MEFSFPIVPLLPETITLLSIPSIPITPPQRRFSLSNTWYYAPEPNPEIETWKHVQDIVDTLGEKSALAQGLRQPVTSYDRLRRTDGQRVYVMRGTKKTKRGDVDVVVGMIKVGVKSLFLVDEMGIQHQSRPLSVLDFYVHESLQKKGYGKSLFEFMLKNENVTPEMLAYDRPSYKLMGFLKKHYKLWEYVPQAINYVVFKGFDFRVHHKSVIKPRDIQQKVGQKSSSDDNARQHNETHPQSGDMTPVSKWIKQPIEERHDSATDLTPSRNESDKLAHNIEQSGDETVVKQPTVPRPRSARKQVHFNDCVEEIAIESRESGSRTEQEMAMDRNTMAIRVKMRKESDEYEREWNRYQQQTVAKHRDGFVLPPLATSNSTTNLVSNPFSAATQQAQKSVQLTPVYMTTASSSQSLSSMTYPLSPRQKAVLQSMGMTGRRYSNAASMRGYTSNPLLGGSEGWGRAMNVRPSY